MSLLQVEEIHEHRSAPAFFDAWRGPSLLATVDEDGIGEGLAINHQEKSHRSSKRSSVHVKHSHVSSGMLRLKVSSEMQPLAADETTHGVKAAKTHWNSTFKSNNTRSHLTMQLQEVDQNVLGQSLTFYGGLGQGHEESKWTGVMSDDHLVPTEDPDAIQNVSSCLSSHARPLRSVPVVRHKHRPPSAPIQDS